MSDLPFQAITIAADIVIFLFVGYYLIKLHKKEKELEAKETKVDTNYHQIVNDALSKERKILEDATREADQIITGAQYLSNSSKELVGQALQKIMTDTQANVASVSQEFMNAYSTYLKQIATNSLNDFSSTTKGMQSDMARQIQEFHSTMLPKLEKELEEYKKERLRQTEQTITRVVQKASQEILNKTIPLEDHQNLIVDAMEKARQEGVFE